MVNSEPKKFFLKFLSGVTHFLNIFSVIAFVFALGFGFIVGNHLLLSTFAATFVNPSSPVITEIGIDPSPMGFVVGSIQKIWIILFVIHIICSIVTMVLAKIDLGSQNTDLENKAYKRGLTGLSISLILLAVVFLAMDKFLYFTEHFFKGTSA